jgi:hypothetical protein
MDLAELRAEVIKAQNRLEQAERKAYQARKEHSAAWTEYSNAVALKVYGFKIGDVIEFTKKGRWGGKSETVRMKIIRFSVSMRDDYSDEQPSINGLRVRKDGTVGTKDEHCHPSLEDYSDIKKIT